MNDTVRAGAALALIGLVLLLIGGQTMTEVGRIVGLVGLVLVIVGLVRPPRPAERD